MSKAVLHIEIDAELLRRAREAGLDPAVVAAAALESALPSDSRIGRAQAWAAENADAIRDHEERIERYGIIGDDLRTW